MNNKIKIFLNGILTEIEANLNILQLIESLELDSRKIAVEKDLTIINAVDFEKTNIEANCQIEIVHFIGGG